MASKKGLDIDQMKRDVEALISGRPVRQAIVRRMVVKGWRRFAVETFTAPFQRQGKKRRSHGTDER